MRGVPAGELDAAVDKAIKTTFLEPVRHQSVDTLSKGYRHRTCFAQSIIHDPEVLILDEPTDGLDPNQKNEIRQLIRRMGEDESDHFLYPHSGRGGGGPAPGPSSSTAATVIADGTP